MDDKQVSTNEIMEFLQDHMVMKEEFNGLHEEFNGLRDQVQGLGDQVQRLEVKVNQVKFDILDSMDEKLGSMKGDIIVMMRNEDKKLMLVVQKLKEKNIFNDHDLEELLTLMPFPQLVRPS